MKGKWKLLLALLTLLLLAGLLPVVAAADPADNTTFDVTFAVEGLDSQVFEVTSAVNGDFTGQTAVEYNAGDKVTFTPPAHYEYLPGIFRIMGMNDTFTDTDDYIYKGIRIEVDGEEYAEYIPADLSELDVAEIYEIGEIEIQFGNPGNGHLMFRAASCNDFSDVVLTAVYEEKQPAVPSFDVTFAVEGGITGKTFTVQQTNAADASYTGQPDQEVTSGTKLTFTPRPNYTSSPNVFRIKGVNTTFVDTDDYEFKGFRVTVDETTYPELLPSQVEEGFVYQVADEIEIQVAKTGNLTFRAASCNDFSDVVLTAVYEEKQPAESMTLEFGSDCNEAGASLGYAVTAVLAAGGADQLIVEKNEITTNVTDEISFAGHENDKYTFRFGINEIANDQYQFKNWTINGIPANDFLVSKFSVEIGDYLFITAPVSALQQMENQKLAVVACFEKKTDPGTGPFGEFTEDTLTYRTGLSYTFEGQRTSFISIPFEFSRECTNVTLKAYYGESASGDAFYVEEFGEVNPQEIYLSVVSQTMPKVSKITLEMTADGADPVTKTFDVTVKDSGETSIDWMTPPSGGTGYPSDCKTAITGPNIYDSAAFVDPATGEVKLYFAVSGGVMQYADGSLISMDGIRLGYHDNEYASGYALAIGGENANQLAAFIKSSGQSNTQATYYIAYCDNNGTWEKAGNSDLSQVFYPDALVLSQNSIWVSDRHWNGTSWVANAVTFNSFWKSSDGTAYAGSASGIYKYAGGEWTPVSGVTGTAYISSGCRNADGSVTLITSSAYEIERASQWHNMSGAVQKVVINGTTATSSVIDISGLTSQSYQVANKHTYVGIASDGAIYGITDGPVYDLSALTSYYASWLFAYENGEWVYQNVDAFNNATDKANIAAGKLLGSIETPKQQPDGIRHIENPIDGVTIFAGQGGGNYIVFGSATISFDSNGGSPVASITQAIGSAVTPPASPTRDGFTFAGWYLSNMDIAMGNAPYKWTVMPASNITLYAKWTESSGGNEDPLEAEKEHAKESLQAVVDRLTQSDYDRATWAAIQEACSEGKAAIDAASTYDGVYDALNAAVDEINDLSKNTAGTATVAVTVEKLTVDGKYIIEPTLVECAKYERASVVVTDLLKEFWKDSYDGTPYTMTGTEVADFYLSGVWDGTTMLSEFDHGQQSGWLYCVNGSFPGVGASAYTLKNGDVMRWQYSCSGLGADIGNNNSSWGGSSGVTVADKDALIWKIAEINQAGEQEKYGDAYDNAMTALQTIEAPQATVDAALAALNAMDGADEQAAADKAAAKAVDEMIASIGRVTLNSENAIQAARRAYNALTPQQKALVENLDVLEAAEERLAELKAASGNNGGNSGGNGSHHNGGHSSNDNNNNNNSNNNNNGNEGNNTPPSPPSQTYADVPANAWFADAVDYVTDKGLMQGVGANLFAPNAATSRAMIVTVLYRLAGSPAVNAENPFSDVAAGSWYADAVAWANANGIVEGYGNGKFGPDDSITREQLAAILYRFAKAQGYDVSQTADLSGYGDAGQVDGWAQQAMAWACGTGLIQGDEQHNLLPGQGATRAQVAAILMRFVESAK